MEVILDNGKINALRANHDMISKFPFLMLNASKKSGCCGRGSTTVPDYNAIKVALSNQLIDKKTEFKNALNADKLTFHVQEGTQIKMVTI